MVISLLNRLGCRCKHQSWSSRLFSCQDWLALALVGLALALACDTIPDDAWVMCQRPFPLGSVRERKHFDMTTGTGLCHFLSGVENGHWTMQHRT